MADGLDAPTVYRMGQPALGVPVMALDYRGAEEVGVSEKPIPEATRTAFRALGDLVVAQGQHLDALEARVARLEQPWWRRLWAAILTLWRS